MSTKKSSPKPKKLSSKQIIWRVILSIAVPLGGGFLISLLTMNAMETFNSFNQPFLAPPAWIFPVAWTILYILMGLASFFIFYSTYSSSKIAKHEAKSVLILYGIQLFLNFGWTIIFFNLGQFWFAFAWLIAMWMLIIIIIIKAYKLSRPAFYMLLPYLAWTTFAAYLNLSIAILN